MPTMTMRSKGFRWFVRGPVRAKGYLFDDNDKLFAGSELPGYFLDVADLGELRRRLTRSDGSFAVIIDSEDRVLAAVDRLRSIPLFHAGGGHDFAVADDARGLVDEAAPLPLDPIASEEFLRVGYTLNATTLFSDVQQLKAGQLLAIAKQEGTEVKEQYSVHRKGDFRHEPDEVLMRELDDVYDGLTRRLIASAQGRPLIVALSGGYDSRSVLCCLKRAGFRDVVCYTYGKTDSFETRIAARVASAVGYPLHVVEYTAEKWQRVVDSPEFAEFCRFASHDCAAPCVQELPALEELSSRGLIPPDGVVVPGYCGDLLGGSQIPLEFRRGEPERVLAQGIDEYIFTLFELFRRPVACEVRCQILDRIHEFTAPFPSHDPESFSNVFEDWFTGHKVARFVVNAVRTYEWFDHEWRLPLWDRQLIEWWYRIPLPRRIHSVLYRKYLFERLFEPQGVAFISPQHAAEHRAAKGGLAASIRCLGDGVRQTVRKAVPSPLLGVYRWIRDSLFDPRTFVNRNGWDELSSLITAKMPAEYRIDDFPSINGVIAAWYLLRLRGVATQGFDRDVRGLIAAPPLERNFP